jgi:DNA-binding XRE family transcriptional regulator
MCKENLQQIESEKGKMKMTKIMTSTKKGSFAELKGRLEEWIKQGKQEPAKRKEITEWKEEMVALWKEEGSEYKGKRKELGIKVKDVAVLLGVSESRIYKLERGLPIRDARLLKKAYELALD